MDRDRSDENDRSGVARKRAWAVYGARLLVMVNYPANQSQCYVRLPFTDLGGGRWRLQDLMGNATYDRDGDEVTTRGLFLDVVPWHAAVFSLSRL